MTHIAVIAGSNRSEAQSHRIGVLIAERLTGLGATSDLISLRDIDVPMWHESKRDKNPPADSPWVTVWRPVSERLKAADGVVVITPEWHGMVSPMLKNLLCCCEEGELAFKPGYIVAVSGGAGGAYPVSELRTSGYKNTYLHWLPDHLIIRNAGGFLPGSPDDKAPEFLEPRMMHGLKILTAYAEAAKKLRAEVVDLSILRNGM
ncbi:MAG: NAD(P)H-dependent oxidoreductase [Rhodobacteraceae bacterium]|nr:NAD(P)H-dependent oxidoreductase [Paracoccaceae bacterium]